ncbi:tripartite tricarboxylate transporter substrate binding protein [Ramlibacter tataouinensis]|uniref:tripartite tricarboxylate transporter substrate binding protein n=1 Tax=Ramlibacter tataouinensis TaxID=94132 RepID=UPI0022F4067E|nr:tripartite tricarboxylate transporter substrate binding protein [Ramlibacter tataouinensis]WBY00232.1 tripartite tricarboxylate transporter substrate binding protein [Ramlibacter tataouinensis]
MNTQRRHLLALGAGALLAGLAQPALAQSGSGRFVVPYAAGGTGDLLARAVSERIGPALGRNFIVDNKPGGGTVIGTQFAAQAPADGATLLFVAASFVIQPQLQAKPAYDALRDYAPVTQLASNPHVLVVHPAVPAKTLAEFVAWAKANKAAFASFGNGSSGHLGFELFKKASGFDMVHVAHKGSAPATQDLLGGHVHAMFADLPQVVGHIKAGKLRAIAVGSARRDAALPEVPTFGEAGLPGFLSQSWYGVVVKAGTPPDAVQKLQAAIATAMADPRLRQVLEPTGLDIVGNSAADFGAFLQAESARYGEAIRISGARID